LTLVGDKGIASIDYISSSIKLYNEEEEIDIKVEKKEPLRNELEHFIECIEKDKNPLISVEDGRKVLKVALSAIESYKENKIVKISD